MIDEVFVVAARRKDKQLPKISKVIEKGIDSGQLFFLDQEDAQKHCNQANNMLGGDYLSVFMAHIEIIKEIEYKKD